MSDHIKASIERLFHKIPAMKFPLISMSNFPNIYHLTVNAHCTHFLPGAPLTASSGALIFVPQTGFAEICFSIILSSSVASRNLIPKPTSPQIRPSCQTPKVPDHAVKQQFKRKRTDEKIMQI